MTDATPKSGAPPEETPREQFGAYIVIPARVFFDQQLPPRAVLFYGLISCMANFKGFCWAKNATLMRYLGVKEDKSVRRWLRQLQDLGYIRVEDAEGGKAARRIYLTDALPDPTRSKMTGDPGQKRPGSYNSINNNNLITPQPPTGGDDPGDDFEEIFRRFWAAWPTGHKIAPKRARRALAKAIRAGAPLEEILASVERHKVCDQWTRDDGKYIPHPATWLNGGCWEDDLTAGPAPEEEEARYW